jgi:DNA adenine methylase
MPDTQARVAPPLPPPLKWAGGKRWLVPILRPLWDRHEGRRLVEPFCGALAVTLGLRPVRALCNDVNPHLMTFLQWLQRGLPVTLPMRNDPEFYYAARARFNALVAAGAGDGAEAAQLTYYLNRTGYNGLHRQNRRGEFNVPFGRHRRVTYAASFEAYRAVLAGWILRCGPFEDVPLAPDDFVYADPPYDVPFTHYHAGGFGWDDQVRLAQWLARHPGPVVASNQATPRVLELYGDLGFAVRTLEAPRRISCTGDRTPAREMLAVRNL